MFSLINLMRIHIARDRIVFVERPFINDDGVILLPAERSLPLLPELTGIAESCIAIFFYGELMGIGFFPSLERYEPMFGHKYISRNFAHLIYKCIPCFAIFF